ncbi:hypothetical protein GCM10022399_42320 [Terrabacter ginsenosidimutans]|uniref:AAA family ATPase n=1 Tax=Terrabacter ginsenosidimutans TaxID=490575 RepID=A0ABP7ET73_9MICO
MVASHRSGPQPVAVHIRSYKNFQNVWLPWADGIALFGLNGVGKTNLLEALAILLGTDHTVALARHRFPDLESVSLSIVCRVAWDEMPLAPDVIAPLNLAHAGEDLIKKYPVVGRVLQDRAWWQELGATEGWSFADGLASAQQGVDEDVLQLIREMEEGFYHAYVRYDLESLQIAEHVDAVSRLDKVERRLARTLVAEVGHGDLESLSAWPSLHGAFDPADLSDFAGFVELVRLPDVQASPIALEWLPRARESREANAYLEEAYEVAETSAKELAAQLSLLPIGTVEFDPDVIWWLHLVLRQALQEELSLTLPHMEVEIIAEGRPDLALVDRRRERPVARTGDSNVLEFFSAGERRWVDEALASGARALARAAARAAWQAPMLERVHESELIGALGEVTAAVQTLYDRDGYWSGEAMVAVLRALDDPLVAAAEEVLKDADDPLNRGLVEAQFAGLSSLRRPTTVRVIDEPEAHLHPAAQRTIASALERLRLRGENIVVASHSPQFLDLPHWQLVHVEATLAGTTIHVLTPGETDARHGLAVAMGWTRGELLSLVSYVLVVEGEHDRIVLEELYGQDLREAGVAILRMHGTSHLLATADMDFLLRHMNVPVGVMVDYASMEHVRSSRPDRFLTGEERSLRELERECKRKGRPIDVYGLRWPDIVAYIDDDVVRQLHSPDFPGWAFVVRRFKELSPRPSFKPWVLEEFGVDLTTAYRVREAVKAMSDIPLTRKSDLSQAVQSILGRAHEGQWLSSSYTDGDA